MTTRARESELEGRLPPAALVSSPKRYTHTAAEDGNITAKKHDNCVVRIDARAEDARLDGLKNADRKDVDSRSIADFKSEMQKETEGGAGLQKEEVAQVRADGQVSRDVAELANKKGEVLKLGGSRNDEDHEPCEEERTANEILQEDATKRNRTLQGAMLQGVRQAQMQHQRQQPPPQQGPVVRWERFLPQRQLRVLLVEDDDSTRHVVSALLRNCSYEVTSAANGLLAWELLMDQTSRVDLVLTEVVMPCLSGIALLSRMMGHGACKHIPVIMMSSHDSMGIVFKCLSKGAVDFLVKPVRKNELKNLWQHVWRRCHSSSGSGSGSASQTRKVTRSKGAADCNISGSNDESDNASSGLNVRGGSDNGSGTQSSWTKRAVEVESAQQRINWDLTGLDTVSGQYVPNQAENTQGGEAKGFASAVEPNERHFDNAMGQDLEMSTLRLAQAEPAHFHNDKGPMNPACVEPEIPPATSSGVAGMLDEDAGMVSLQEDSRKAIDLIGAIASKAKIQEDEEQGDSGDADDLLENHASNSPSSKEKTFSDADSPPLLELTLKRPRQTEEEDRGRDDRRILRHSYSSAFSRYNTNGNLTLLPSGSLSAATHCKSAGYGGQPFLQGSSVEGSNPLSVPLSERVASSKGSTDVAMQSPYLANVSHVVNKQDCLAPAFPSGKDNFTACAVKEESIPSHQISGAGRPMSIPLQPGTLYDGLPTAYGPMHHPVFYNNAAAPHWGSAAPVADRGEADDCCGSYEQSQAHPPHPQVDHHSQAHHHSHHHSHHHHHHIQHHYHHHHQHVSQQRALTSQQEDQTVTNIGPGAPRCGSSNIVNGPEGNNVQSGSSNGNGNGSVNGSATGSNNGSKGHNNGQSAVALAAGGNGESGNQVGNGGIVTGNAVTVANGLLSSPDQNRFARREAALTKFRQKRKERCFEKKVRYQSRKRLAEQRPRVRGQFVRQSVYESTAGEPD